MKLSMGKHKQDSGFTLIEILLVLFLVSLLFLLFPLFSTKRGSVLTMQVEALKYTFLQAQTKALYEKQSIAILCDGTNCYIDDSEIPLQQDMRCYGEVKFNESGNASRATTFLCSIASHKRKLIVQLGSGRMYVK